MSAGHALDSLFRDAVSAIDAGDVASLEHQIAAYPALVHERLDAAGAWLRDTVKGALDGFFKAPYLLWFVAEDPVRNGTLPANIADVTLAIVRAIKGEKVDSLQAQLDYALNLVSCALKGKAEAVRRLIAFGIDINGVSEDLYSHATALHHAVSSGSIDTVRVLVEAGANLGAPDTVYHGTPLGWAEYSGGKPQYDAIAAYLRSKGARQ